MEGSAPESTAPVDYTSWPDPLPLREPGTRVEKLLSHRREAMSLGEPLGALVDLEDEEVRRVVTDRGAQEPRSEPHSLRVASEIQRVEFARREPAERRIVLGRAATPTIAPPIEAIVTIRDAERIRSAHRSTRSATGTSSSASLTIPR